MNFVKPPPRDSPSTRHEDNKFTLITVDDNDETLENLRRFFQGHLKYMIRGEASNGAEAIMKARAFRPDFVLLDLTMPEVDGWDALPEIIAASPATRVIIVSAHDKRFWPMLEAHGASGYYEKGEPLKNLVEILDRLTR